MTSDLAAPTAKWAISEMTAAVMTASIPYMKKKGMTGMIAPTAVESQHRKWLRPMDP